MVGKTPRGILEGTGVGITGLQQSTHDDLRLTVPGLISLLSCSSFVVGGGFVVVQDCRAASRKEGNMYAKTYPPSLAPSLSFCFVATECRVLSDLFNINLPYPSHPLI